MLRCYDPDHIMPAKADAKDVEGRDVSLTPNGLIFSRKSM
jgi:hypothetical protein